jgi:hypothetical protein
VPAKKAARSGNPAKKAVATRPQCSANVGGDPASGCDRKANGKDGLCTVHRRALKILEASDPSEDPPTLIPIVPVPPPLPGSETVQQED